MSSNYNLSTPEGRMECPRCDGWGSIEREMYADGDPVDYAECCPRCDGEGNVEILEVLAQ